MKTPEITVPAQEVLANQSSDIDLNTTNKTPERIKFELYGQSSAQDRTF